ncbi:hypothetical protein [Haloarchaeobius iranensis]|uniref:Uncharacterized protein n=1 Tax=Haloarchaeobius iranensis TaxID=996166 RepID=A0A1H0A5N3_9EURY|nr:hypothetical protein [Haloarchaeobius iranensis]SDN28969.1 hypothetical protein SAMN05192554_12513 [Haloarchaeobius iranensis]
MPRPPLDPRTRQFADDLTWRRIVTSYLLVAAVPFALWAVHSPLAAATTLVAGGTLGTGARHAYRLARCVQRCKRLTFDLFGTARITVRRPPADDACC